VSPPRTEDRASEAQRRARAGLGAGVALGIGLLNKHTALLCAAGLFAGLAGPELGLPPPISGANSYFGWGPPDGEPEAVLGIGCPAHVLASLFQEVTPVGEVKSPYGFENRFDFPRTISLCRGRKQSLRDAWPILKHFD
jgi:hypothetical protein